MTRRHKVVAGLLAAGLVAGTLSDRPVPTGRRAMGGYEVLVGDFHVHSFPGSWGLLSPWDDVIEARRQGFDVIAMTPHNHIWVAKTGRWFADLVGGPIVIVGEEIAHADYHLIAVGIERTIPPMPRAPMPSTRYTARAAWRLPRIPTSASGRRGMPRRARSWTGRRSCAPTPAKEQRTPCSRRCATAGPSSTTADARSATRR
jgi:hypothetical protein